MKRHPNYFRLLDRPGGDDHPIDLLVRERLHQGDAQKRLVALQGQVRDQLGKNTRAFFALETLRNDMNDERVEAYFNVGFEHGLLEGAARASGVALSKPVQNLVRDLLALIEQAQLPRDLAAFVALQVLGGVLLSGPNTLPPGRALASGTPQ